MASEHLTIAGSGNPTDLTLRAADWNDQDSLRNWKNNYRQFFFSKAVILPEQQMEWFRGYGARERDYMFMVEVGGRAIGCMGVRLLENAWDVYNVILGEPAAGGKGHMSRALRLMLAFAYCRRSCAVQLKVLRSNPAAEWYERNGFRVVAEGDDHLLMRHERDAVAEPAIAVAAQP